VVAARLLGDALRLTGGDGERFEAACAQYERAVEACRAIGAENELPTPWRASAGSTSTTAIPTRAGATSRTPSRSTSGWGRWAPDAVRASLG
jgi:hypothetical protein